MTSEDETGIVRDGVVDMQLNGQSIMCTRHFQTWGRLLAISANDDIVSFRGCLHLDKNQLQGLSPGGLPSSSNVAESSDKSLMFKLFGTFPR